MHCFPTLFKKSKTGKVSQWDISVSKNVIYIEHGYVDGKKQKDTRLLKEGKNLNRANATTPEQQAMQEAESLWKKQHDKGYVESLLSVDNIVYLPMLAQKYTERKKYITYPCYVQPKLDGVRCFARVIDGEVILTSRNGKRFPHMEHLFEDIKMFPNIENLILDGELYSDKESFNTVVGLVKKEKLSEEDKVTMKNINLRLYDCVFLTQLDAPFMSRINFIYDVFDDYTFHNLERVCSIQVDNEKEAMEKHDLFVREGFEGLILRNFKGAYDLNKRSNNLQKYKNFHDDEYKIVGFEEGEGRALGTVVWVCQTKEGKTFKVRPRGTENERRHWFYNGKKYIGENLTVRYQELTEDGIPRFPVGVAIRSYE
jgi:DNA ligase-1